MSTRSGSRPPSRLNIIVVILDDRIQSVIARAVVLDLLYGEGQVVDSNRRLRLLQLHQAVAVGKGQRLNENGVGGAECSRARAYGESENQDRDAGEAQILAHHAQSVVAVLNENFAVFADCGHQQTRGRVPPETRLRECGRPVLHPAADRETPTASRR